MPYFFNNPDTLQSKAVYADSKVASVACPSVTKDLECDIVIVGGGLAGLSLAYHLAQHGKKFILIESEKIGDCASGINGGFCSPGWSIDFETLVRRYGSATAKVFYQISLEGLQWISSFKNNKNFQSMECRSGIMNLSLLESEMSARKKFLANNPIVQSEAEFIPKKRLINYVNSPLYRSGIFFKSGFSFNPLNFLNGLKNEITLKQPNSLFEKSKMVSFHENYDSCTIKLTNGCSIKAEKLVIATGGYGGYESGYLRTRWLPVTTSIAVTSCLKKNVSEIINPQFAFSDDRRAGNYYRLISKNRLLWGRGINAICCPNFKTLKKSVRKDIRTFFPNIVDEAGGALFDFEYMWSGKMAYSKSMMPYVGRLTSRTYSLMGFGGHGMNTAPAGAKVLSENLLGLSDRVNVFKKIPLHWNGYKFGPFAAELMYGLRSLKDGINRQMLRLTDF